MPQPIALFAGERRQLRSSIRLLREPPTLFALAIASSYRAKLKPNGFSTTSGPAADIQEAPGGNQ